MYAYVVFINAEYLLACTYIASKLCSKLCKSHHVCVLRVFHAWCLAYYAIHETSEITMCLRMVSMGSGEWRGGWSEERGGGNMEKRRSISWKHGKKVITSCDVAFAYPETHFSAARVTLVQHGSTVNAWTHALAYTAHTAHVVWQACTFHHHTCENNLNITYVH